MREFLNTPWRIGSLQLPNRLIQGPLAGFSCAPFRQLFSLFHPPAWCVSEMLSAHNVVHKDSLQQRYLWRGPEEKRLAYQISGTDPALMAEAAAKLEQIGADLIDINCGCPKSKIRKKGAGSALLEQPERLAEIVRAVRSSIRCPLTVKLRLPTDHSDVSLAERIQDAGADALIIHGRTRLEDYNSPCNLKRIAQIKQALAIPVIANGDIRDTETLTKTVVQTGCDGFMLARAATGKPWLFQELLSGQSVVIDRTQRTILFIKHLQELAQLENEYQAILQSKSLIRYYFRNELAPECLQTFYRLSSMADIHCFLEESLSSTRANDLYFKHQTI